VGLAAMAWFMELCRHWQVLARDEVNRRVEEARRQK